MKTTPTANIKKAVSQKEASTKSQTAGKRVPKQKKESLKAGSQTIPLTADRKEANSFTVVAIGASAGGLEAVTQLLENLSPTTGMAYIYVQHLSPDHKSLLSSILSNVTEMVVQEIDDMEKMEPNNVYVIPSNKEIEVTDGHIKLIPRAKDKTSNLSIDILFSSLADACKENVIGIVLSGSASDGTRGLKEIKEAGGITFAQDDTAKFTSMPHSAISEGVVDFVLSPKEIAMELNWISKHPLIRRFAVKNTPEDDIENSDPDLKDILQLLLKKKNIDFSHYKMNTIKRRMLRRMLIHKIKTIKQYADLLGKTNDEVDLLFQDLLINVTGFFRDADAFLLLKKSVLPRLLKSKAPNETLRIWVAACATGEEVYSIAMSLLELQENKTYKTPFQIFASDLSAMAINEARIGEYSIQQLKNVSPKRLQQFFTKSKDKYRITKALRDVCVFAQHNILRDPPFSRMDFISCRNLLIYLDNAAQKKTISTFHYALNEGGYLMLGKSETVGTSEDLFTPLNKKFKIFSRKKNSGVFKIPDISPQISPHNLPEINSVTTVFLKKIAASPQGNLGSAFDTALLAHYMPASVIINHDLEILQFRGSTEMFLEHPSGKATFNILRMARPEISLELRNAITQAVKTKRTVSKYGIEMKPDKTGNTTRIANIEVVPLKVEGEGQLLMIVFTAQLKEILEQSDNTGNNNILVKERRIKKLEEELAAARSAMSSIIQDQEAAYEELQSANEEIVSSNEELQSLNEELETSKEEIESTNEELTTSNYELLARNQQVEELYNYYEAILSAVQEPMLILDKDIRIKSANKSFYKIFHVTEDECLGRSLYNLGNNQWNIPRLRELIEDIVPKNIRFHNFEVEHTFPVIGHRIMLLNAYRIIQQSKNEELIVLTIIDITEIRRLAIEIQLKETKALEKQLEVEKKALKLIEDSNKRYNMMLMHSPFAFAILKGKEMRISLANDSIKEIWGKGKRIEGKPLLEILPEIKDGPVPALLNNVFTSGIPYQGHEFPIPLVRKEKLENIYFNMVFQPYLEADETISGVTVIAYEVTTHVIAKEELIKAKINAEKKTLIAEEAMNSKQQFLSNMSHEIRTPMNAIIGFTKVLLRTDLSAKQKEYLNAIKISGDSLIELINDILDLAKVDSGKMTFEQTPFKMLASVSAILHLFEKKIQENNTELVKVYDHKIPEVLLGDSLRLRQIIMNLMSNAVKFTSGGKITVSVRMLKEDEEKVTIEFGVEDTGIGIPEDKLDKIFENFQQASSGISKMYGGTGLGLAIVKQLVESQGGSLHVKSQIEKGSTFSFILSFLKTKTILTAEVEKKELNIEIKNIKALVVEDIVLNQLLMKTLLDDFGFECDIASNGKVAIEMLQDKSYDIILMDLHMPEMNGFEATKYIRNKMHSKTPIIALTADVTTVDLAKCEAVGMNDYISKPVEERSLYSKIVGMVSKSKSLKPFSSKQYTFNIERAFQEHAEREKSKCTDLTFLKYRTKSDPKLMMEMISLYLEQTPPLISAINQSLQDKDWDSLYKAVHKLIPSFSIMGIGTDSENIAKKIQEYAGTKQKTDEIPDLVIRLEKICMQACEELKEVHSGFKDAEQDKL
ncbi:MAG: ATP-binding protein [Bacteroidetes bacterium]|nr:ATP-binding protein [Bacteroidota bacterium]MCL6103776.1 ATP-binding protein [Bacteroidota bacterium]